MKNRNNCIYLKKLWRLNKGKCSECVYGSRATKIVWFSCKIPRIILAALLLFMVTKEELAFHGGEIQDWDLNLWSLAKLYWGLWASFSTHRKGGVDLGNMVVYIGKSILVARNSSMQIVGTPILL